MEASITGVWPAITRKSRGILGTARVCVDRHLAAACERFHAGLSALKAFSAMPKQILLRFRTGAAAMTVALAAPALPLNAQTPPSLPGLCILVAPVSYQLAGLVLFLCLCLFGAAVLLAIFAPGLFLRFVKGRVFIRTVIIAICFLVGCWLYPSFYVTFVVNPVFQGAMDEFTTATEATATNPYVKKRILIVDKDKRRVDTLQMFLPDDLRARNPEEVGTIVWLEDSESKAGDYHEEGTGKFTGSGFVRVVEVSLIDRGLHSIISRQRFRGSDPPPKASSAGDERGSYPSALVKSCVENLRTLPRL